MDASFFNIVSSQTSLFDRLPISVGLVSIGIFWLSFLIWIALSPVFSVSMKEAGNRKKKEKFIFIKQDVMQKIEKEKVGKYY